MGKRNRHISLSYSQLCFLIISILPMLCSICQLFSDFIEQGRPPQGGCKACQVLSLASFSISSKIPFSNVLTFYKSDVLTSHQLVPSYLLVAKISVCYFVNNCNWAANTAVLRFFFFLFFLHIFSKLGYCYQHLRNYLFLLATHFFSQLYLNSWQQKCQKNGEDQGSILIYP